ncbi:MAG TPA: flippase [Gemmatimonadales bacterium]
MKRIGIGGLLAGRNRFVRHTAWNVAAISVPVLAGLLAVPVLTRALGPARFGILALAWALLEYLTVFDFGLSRATLHHVARRADTEMQDLSRTVSASLTAQTGLGAIAGLLVVLLSGFVVRSVLKVPPELEVEAHRAFLVLGATMPLVLLALALRTLLEAAERFDLSAAVRAPSSAATFLVPAVAAAAGASLPTILALLLLVRALTCVATLQLVRRALPGFRLSRPRELATLRRLAGFGGWIAVTNVLTPFFLYFDRLLLGALAGVAAVGYYAAPFELGIRLLVLPAAVTGSVFPAASALLGEHREVEVRRLYAGSSWALLLLLLPVVVLGVVIAPAFLGWWLGPDFAGESATVLRFLLPGVLASALAHLPVAFLQAGGRADVSGRLHVAMAVLHAVACSALVLRYGAVGAAAAFTLRATVDAVLAFALASTALRLPHPFRRVGRSELAVP